MTHLDAVGLEAALRAWFNRLPCDGIGKEHFDALLKIAASAPEPVAAHPSSMQVVKLEWSEEPWAFEARCLIGDYQLFHKRSQSPGIQVVVHPVLEVSHRVLSNDAGSLDAAKAIAQSDFDTRIRSALVAAPVEGVEKALGMRPETETENLLRDMKEGRFPQRSEPKMVPDVEDAWSRIGADPELQRARQKLSMHELRRIIQHAKESSALPHTDNGNAPQAGEGE